MATRWQKLRDELKLKELVYKDILDANDSIALNKLTELEFNCNMCKYNWTNYHEYGCTDSIEECREGFADYLNQEVEE